MHTTPSITSATTLAGEPTMTARAALARLRTAAAVLFDFNGTLSADEDLMADIYCRIAAEYGLVLTSADYHRDFLGLSDPQIAAALAARTGADDAEATAADDPNATAADIAARLSGAYRAAIRSEPRITPDACRLVAALASAGVPLAVVTGTYRRLVDDALQAAGIRAHFKAVIACEDVSAGKPAPEGFLTAARILGVAADERVIVVEDSAPGRAAAEAAGMAVLMVGPERLQLSDIGAVLAL